MEMRFNWVYQWVRRYIKRLYSTFLEVKGWHPLVSALFLTALSIGPCVRPFGMILRTTEGYACHLRIRPCNFITNVRNSVACTQDLLSGRKTANKHILLDLGVDLREDLRAPKVFVSFTTIKDPGMIPSSVVEKQVDHDYVKCWNPVVVRRWAMTHHWMCDSCTAYTKALHIYLNSALQLQRTRQILVSPQWKRRTT